MTNKNDNQLFETNIESLESIVENMESGKLSLKDSLEEYEKGIKLAIECKKALNEAQQSVQILSQKAQSVELKAFTPIETDNHSNNEEQNK